MSTPISTGFGKLQIPMVRAYSIATLLESFTFLIFQNIGGGGEFHAQIYYKISFLHTLRTYHPSVDENSIKG